MLTAAILISLFSGLASAQVSFEGRTIPLSHKMGISWAMFPQMPTTDELRTFQEWHNDEKLPNLGGGNEVGTFRWETSNRTPSQQHLAIVSTEEMTADLVYLTILRSDGSSEIAKAGVLIGNQNATFPARAFILPFKIAPNETVTLFMSIKSSYTRNLHYQVMTVDDAVRFDFNASIFMGFYFGTMLFAASFGVIIFVTTRSSIAFAHSFYCIMTLLSASIGLGYLVQIIPFNATITASKVESILIWIIFGSSCWFVREATNAKSWSRFFYYAQSMLMLLCLVNAVLGFDSGYGNYLTLSKEIIVPVGAVLGISTTLCGWLSRKSEHAKYVFIGLGPYFTFGAIWEMQFSSQIPAYIWAAYGVFGVQVFQNIFFSVPILAEYRKFNQQAAHVREAALTKEKMSNLVKVLTHDLANYTAIMSTGAELLAQSSENREIRTNITSRITRALQQQREFIESIRQINLMESNDAKMVTEPIDLRELLDDVPNVLESKLKSKDITINFSCSPDKMMVIAERKTAFHCVLLNIFTNAIKFSPQMNTIDVSCETTPETIQVHIKDYGIGIPKDLREKIFDATSVTSRRGTQGEAGTGFGLPICQAFMKEFGGSVAVESITEEDSATQHGTTVTLTFKRALELVS